MPETIQTEMDRVRALVTVAASSSVDGARTEAHVILKPINSSPTARDALESQAAANMALDWARENGITSPMMADLPAFAALDENDALVADPNKVKTMGRRFKIQRNALA